MPSTRQSPARLLLLLAAPFLLLAVGGPALGEEVDRGTATAGAFGFLIAVHNLLLTPLANQLEAMVLGIEQRPWLAGRLRRWQRLILPYSTARVLTVGLTLAFGGGAYLLDPLAGRNAFTALAVVFCACGGALLGFGLSRLAAGIFIVRCSGLWAASRRAWLAGGLAVAIGSVAFGTQSIAMTLRLSPVL